MIIDPGFRQGKVYPERAALPRLALHGDPPSVGLHDVIDDRQPEAAALDVVDQTGADPVEAFEVCCLIQLPYPPMKSKKTK